MLRSSKFIAMPCLTGPTISEEYITEYSTDKVEMHTGHIKEGQRVLLVSALEQARAVLACQTHSALQNFLSQPANVLVCAVRYLLK